jgi:DhnA family fructose-bisphosphate aldolase class Ia
MRLVMSKADVLSKIFDNQAGRAVVIPLDDSSITGPEDTLRHMDVAIRRAVDGGADAILGFWGLFGRHPELMKDTPGILNITLSTEGPHHLRKVLVGTVNQAKQLGLAVSVHLNITAPHEPAMLGTLGQTAAACQELDVPLLAHVYPRTITAGKENHYEQLQAKDPMAYAVLVRHGARIAADLGADIIKVPFTGSIESFRTVIESTYGLPVLMAGGPKIAVPAILANVHMAMQAGGKGAAVGRNFFKREKGREMVVALRAIVHDGVTVDGAMSRAGLTKED